MIKNVYARGGATNPAFSIASPVRLGRTGPNASNSSIRARGGSITSVSSSSSSDSSSTSRTRSSSNTSISSSPRLCPGSRLAPRAKQGESTTQEIRRFFGVGVSHPKEKMEKSAKVSSPRAAKDTNKVDGTDKVKVLKAPFVVPLRYATPAAAARAAARAAASAISAPKHVSARPARVSPVVKKSVPARLPPAAPRKSPACAVVKTVSPSPPPATSARARVSLSPRQATSRIPRFIGRVTVAATHDQTHARPQCSSASRIPVSASKIQGKNKTKTKTPVKAAPGPSTPVSPPSPPAYSASASVSVSALPVEAAAPASTSPTSAEAEVVAPASCPHCGCSPNTPAPPTPETALPTPSPSPSPADVVNTVEETEHAIKEEQPTTIRVPDTEAEQIAEGIEFSVPVKEKQYASVKTQTDKVADGPTPTPEHRQAMSGIFGGSKSLSKRPETLMQSIKKTQAEDPVLAQIKTRLSDHDDKAASSTALARAALLAQKCRAVEVKSGNTGTPAAGPSTVLRSRRTGVQDEHAPAIEPENELQRAYTRRGLGALSLPTPPATPAVTTTTVIKRFPLRQVSVNASSVPIVVQEDGTLVADGSSYTRGSGKEEETPFGTRKLRRVVVPAYDNDKVFRDARTQLEIQGLRAHRRVGGGGCEQVAVGGSDADEGKRGLSLVAVGLMERKRIENPIDKM